MATSPLSPRTLLRLGELLRALDRAPLHQVLHDVRAPRLRTRCFEPRENEVGKEFRKVP